MNKILVGLLLYGSLHADVMSDVRSKWSNIDWKGTKEKLSVKASEVAYRVECYRNDGYHAVYVDVVGDYKIKMYKECE